MSLVVGILKFLFLVSYLPILFFGNLLIAHAFGNTDLGEDLWYIVGIFVVSLLLPCYVAEWAAKAEKEALNV